MRSPLFLPSAILATVLCFLPTYDASEAEVSLSTLSSDSRSFIIAITDTGVTPPTVHMSNNDTVVFSRNYSLDALVTVDVKSSEHDTLCSSVELKNQEADSMSATGPLSPQDLADTCLQERGEYAFTVRGVHSSPEIFTGRIIIK